MSVNFISGHLVRQILVRQFHARTFGTSISRPSISCLDILMVRHFQRPRYGSEGTYFTFFFTITAAT